MLSFIEIKGVIIEVGNIAWIEYQTAEEIKASSSIYSSMSVEFPVEPEGRTYVIPKSGSEARWIPGDVRDEFRLLLEPRRLERR